jgi:hypothetical protein
MIYFRDVLFKNIQSILSNNTIQYVQCSARSGICFCMIGASQ